MMNRGSEGRAGESLGEMRRGREMVGKGKGGGEKVIPLIVPPPPAIA